MAGTRQTIGKALVVAALLVPIAVIAIGMAMMQRMHTAVAGMDQKKLMLLIGADALLLAVGFLMGRGDVLE